MSAASRRRLASAGESAARVRSRGVSFDTRHDSLGVGAVASRFRASRAPRPLPHLAASRSSTAWPCAFRSEAHGRTLARFRWGTRRTPLTVLIGKAHDYEVLAASHCEREALVGGGERLACDCVHRRRDHRARGRCGARRRGRRCVTGNVSFEVVGFGVDDVTLGFDMTGSKSIGRLNSMPGIETRWGKRLGERGSWGAGPMPSVVQWRTGNQKAAGCMSRRNCLRRRRCALLATSGWRVRRSLSVWPWSV